MDSSGTNFIFKLVYSGKVLCATRIAVLVCVINLYDERRHFTNTQTWQYCFYTAETLNATGYSCHSPLVILWNASGNYLDSASLNKLID